MGYRAGLGASLGGPSTPHIVCDGCSAVVLVSNGVGIPAP